MTVNCHIQILDKYIKIIVEDNTTKVLNYKVYAFYIYMIRCFDKLELCKNMHIQTYPKGVVKSSKLLQKSYQI